MRPKLSATSRSFSERLKRTTDISVRDFETFLWLFDNPELLHALPYMIGNLAEVLPIAEDIPDNELNSKVLSLLKRFVVKIPNPSTTSTERLKLYYINTPKALNPSTEGIFERCPAYSALSHSSKDSDYEENYRLLQAQFLVCFFQKKTDRHIVGSTTVKLACKAIRDLSKRQYQNCLRKLPTGLVSTKDYLQILEGLEEIKQIPDYVDLLRFFRISLGLKKAIEIHSRQPTIHEGDDEITPTEPPGEFPPTAPSMRGSKRSRKRLTRFALEKSRRKAKGKRNAIAKRNARLSIDNIEISLNDFATLLDILSSPKNVILEETDDEIKTLIATMLWTGKTYHEAIKFTLTQSRPLKVGKDQSFLYWTDEEKYWILSSPGPAIQPPSVETLGQYCRTVKEIRLPLTQHTACIIEPYVKARLATLEGPGILFTMNNLQSKSAGQKFLFSIKRSHDTEITLVNLSRFLELQIERLPYSDSSQARLTLGKIEDKKLSMDIEENSTEESQSRSIIDLHYSCFTVASLQNKYIQAASYLESLWLGNVPPEVKFQSSRLEQESYLGTPFRPKRDTIKALVERLQSRIDQIYIDYLEDSTQLAKFHRCFLTYSTVMVNLATTMRAVCECALPWEQINLKSSFAVVCDKNEGDYASSRRIWLPPFVLDQIRYLISHMNVLYNEAVRKSPSLVKAFGLYLPGESKRYISLSDNFNAYLLAPKDLREFTFEFTGFDLRSNWTRPYLRSNLIEAGCPVESVNALLGHAELGRYPWSATSAFNPADYRETLNTYLQKLMLEDGWKAVPGIWREN